MAKDVHNPHAKFKTQWRCTKHGAIGKTRGGAVGHETMSAGKCNIKWEQVRTR